MLTEYLLKKKPLEPPEPPDPPGTKPEQEKSGKARKLYYIYSIFRRRTRKLRRRTRKLLSRIRYAFAGDENLYKKLDEAVRQPACQPAARKAPKTDTKADARDSGKTPKNKARDSGGDPAIYSVVQLTVIGAIGGKNEAVCQQEAKKAILTDEAPKIDDAGYPSSDP